MLSKFVNWQRIDLKRHALIEASAGTGKTYTIENLVIKLLVERDDISLENILLVTFTEKAASELKMRIREKLAENLKQTKDDQKEKKLKDSLDTFDNASIFTIHGFCQNILKEFAFESGILFQTEAINDIPLFESLLKEQMRRRWHMRYGDNLAEILEFCGFNTKKEKFIKTVFDIGKNRYHRGAGDLLKPDFKEKKYSKLKDEIKRSIMTLKAETDSGKTFSEEFKSLKIHGTTKKSLLNNFVYPIENYLSKVDESNFSLIELSELISKIQKVKSKKKSGVSALYSALESKELNLSSTPNLTKTLGKLQNLIENLTELKHLLAVQTIDQLQKDVNQAKQDKGWISFDDMLNIVAGALYNNNSSDLLKKLQKKYKAAFVDEFQDTDPVQWKIFKKIFLNEYENTPQNLLFLIGDPKQAIYSFRGADVYAYLEAKNEIKRLAKKNRANLYSLAENWRSEPGLINAFNHLFCRPEWFKAPDETGEFEIKYQYVNFPDKKKRADMTLYNLSGRRALNIVDLSKKSSPKPAKAMLAKFIADEINYLVNCSSVKDTKKSHLKSKLDFNDICILVRGKSEVPAIEQELSSLEIPYTYYKKPGLFLSDEALHLSLVFHAILEPGNSSKAKKALLTPFFNLNQKDLHDYEYLSVSHNIKQMLALWNEYASLRKWSLLFQSLMEDSGLLFRESETIDWDRKHTNYRQIFEHLETTAYQKNMDFRSIAAMLDSYRNQLVYADEDNDIHQIETEEQKVQIMTMHVSKGLQFPVVFVAGGLTQPPSHGKGYHLYHQIGSNGQKITKIIDLAKLNGKEEDAKERSDEDKRLYYVALTRSQYMLYIPFFPYEKNQQWVGPICRLLSPAVKKAFSQDKSSKNVMWLDLCRKSNPFEVNDKQIQQNEKENRFSILNSKEPSELFPRPDNHQYKKIKVESFSSIHGKVSHFHGKDENAVSQTYDEKVKEDDENFASQNPDLDDAEIISEKLPGGTETGSMLHDILENINFHAVYEKAVKKDSSAKDIFDDPEINGLVLKQMEIYRTDDHWKKSICQIIWNTLTTPVTILDDDFTLCKLKKEERLHEVEFYYAFPPIDQKNDNVLNISTENRSDRFVRGFVDLLFRYKGKYYIADWKSNYIENGYDRKNLEINMVQADYHIQYKIYTIAVLRWLKQALGEGFDPERDFGGIFYFYLRGMGTGGDNGIYYVPADKLGGLEKLEREIQQLI